MAIGGIIIALNRGGGDDPGPVSITPSQPVPPTAQPTEQPTEKPTEQPTDNPTSEEPTPGPTETSEPPSGNSIDLGNGISLSPADGWSVKKTGKGVAQLSDGKNIFLGQSIKVEPSTDPAAEAALKRRIERQIRELLGDRVGDVEVRIVGRDITIRARAVRFWQRRAVRRTLETLPGLAGYRARVEMGD